MARLGELLARHTAEHVRIERTGYGPQVWLFERIRLNSPGTLTPMRPFIRRSGDEYCNDVLAIHLWPLGGVDIWWRRYQRTEADGPCGNCSKDV